LEPCCQRLQARQDITYLGGSLPLPAALRERAISMATRAVARLPGWIGYLGVDLILADDPDGNGDRVVEINPRLTTSYVGLRALARSNLAQTMIDVAEGRRAGLSFSQEPLEFDSDGTVRRISCVGATTRSQLTSEP
jgi:predicted ATP-grasp superfamily ATP-dependent carboligase